MLRHALRSRMFWTALPLALVLALGGCGKADRNKCEQMCRNYATVSFREIEAARLPPAEREKALADKLAKGTEFCINKCVSANNDELSECMIEAKNMREMKDCE